MKRSTRPLSSSGREAQTDPIPLVIVAALIGASAGFGHLIYKIRRDWEQRERGRQQRRRELDSALFASLRALYDLGAQFAKFRTWVIEHQLHEEGLSMFGLDLTNEEASEFRQLLLDIRRSGDRLADQLAEVRGQIEEEKYREELAKPMLELDNNLRSVLAAKTFGEFIDHMEKQLYRSEKLLRMIGEWYDIILP